jgi:hypothetical protein
MTALLKIEAAAIEPKYNDDNGGTGFIQIRTVGGRLISLHVDGSLLAVTVREQVLAVCELVGMDDAATVALMDAAASMAERCLDESRR